MTIQVTDSAIEMLTAAAQQVQTALFDRESEIYTIGDIYEVLGQWLEGAIESLCEDACHHCLTGESGINRSQFERLLAKKPSRNWAEAKAQAEREMSDHLAAGLDRAA